ncbi:hypothetical protein [Amycolatopsis thermoflava]|uniref:hypothetical protein n=1 Tax=Amycolatopsis thermoflava TaxID=84480 RepID=UPI003D763008
MTWRPRRSLPHARRSTQVERPSHHRPVALQDATTDAMITTCTRTLATGGWQTSTTLATAAR